MTYRDAVKAALRVDEGNRCKPYRCSAGKLTIGVGRNLEDVGLRQDEIDYLLDNDIREAERVARETFPSFDTLSDARKAVLINMAFNLGAPRLSLFRQFIAAVNAGDFNRAADEMLDSLWAEQVGQRAWRLAEEMKGG